MTNWKKDAIQTGRKLVIKGKASKTEIIDFFVSQLTELEEVHGVDYFSDFNIYFQMYKNDEKTLLVNNNGDKTYMAYEPNSQNYKKITTLKDGSKNIKYNKEIDFDQIKKSVNEIIENPVKLAGEEILLTSSEYKTFLNNKKIKEMAIRLEIEKKKKAEEEVYLAKQRAEEEIHLAKQRIELKKINDFKNILMIKYSFKDIKELEKATTSINKLTRKFDIIKYIKEDLIPNNCIVYKASFRSGHVDIYNEDLEFIFTKQE